MLGRVAEVRGEGAADGADSDAGGVAALPPACSLAGRVVEVPAAGADSDVGGSGGVGDLLAVAVPGPVEEAWGAGAATGADSGGGGACGTAGLAVGSVVLGCVAVILGSGTLASGLTRPQPATSTSSSTPA